MKEASLRLYQPDRSNRSVALLVEEIHEHVSDQDARAITDELWRRAKSIICPGAATAQNVRNAVHRFFLDRGTDISYKESSSIVEEFRPVLESPRALTTMRVNRELFAVLMEAAATVLKLNVVKELHAGGFISDGRLRVRQRTQRARARVRKATTSEARDSRRSPRRRIYRY